MPSAYCGSSWTITTRRKRPHRGINLEPPVPYLARHQFDSGDVVERVDRLGGLLHQYRLAA
jgi:hypothetical protein